MGEGGDGKFFFAKKNYSLLLLQYFLFQLLGGVCMKSILYRGLRYVNMLAGN